MTVFHHEPPLRRARRAADAELAGKAEAETVVWLNDHPLLWLRALIQIEEDVNDHIAKERAALATLKPPSGHNPAPEYLQAKASFDENSVRRMHFKRIVEKRRADVASMFGGDDRTLLGDAVRVMLIAVSMIEEDDGESAIDVLLRFSQRVTGAGGKT